MRLALVVSAATLLFASVAHAADPTDARAVIAIERQRVETTDARATGRLVQVDASGNRITNAFTLKAHWFPGVLRVLLEVVPSRTPAGSADQDAPHDARASILFEMRSGGQSTIQIFRPHVSAPALLPFAKWDEGVLGSDFDYEDFLQQEFYWQGQTMLKTAKFGARNCDVLKSTPGASDRSHYAEVQTYLDQTNGYPIHAEKTLKSSAAVKGFTSFGLSQTGGVWSARQVEVTVHGRPGSTLLIFERGSTKAHLTLKDFSPEQIGHFDDHP